MRIPCIRMILFACALVGVAPGALDAGVLTAPGKVSVGMVDGKTIEKEAFSTYLEQKGRDYARLTLEERKGWLQEYIIDIKLAKEARGRGLHKDLQVLDRMREFERKELSELYFRKRYFETAVLEEADFEKEFQDLQDLANIRVLVVSDREDADRVLLKVKSGTPFQDLVAEHSEGLGRLQSGNQIGVGMGDNRFTLEEKTAIFSGAPGEIVGPFRNLLGSYSLVQVVEVDTVETQKDRIRKEQGEEIRLRKAQREYLVAINQEMVGRDIEVNEEIFRSGLPAAEESGTGKLVYVGRVGKEYIFPEDIGYQPKGGHSLSLLRNRLDRHIYSMIATDLAIREHMDRDPGYRARREAFFQTQLVSRLYDVAFWERKPKISEREVDMFYKDHFTTDRYQLWVVINQDRAKVESAREEFFRGGDSVEIVRMYSQDSSAFRGGVVGYTPLAEFDPQTQKHIRGLKKGEISPVYKVSTGYCVFRLVDRKKADPPPREEVADGIRARLLFQKRAEFILAKRKDTWKKADYKVYRQSLDTP